MSTFEVLKTAGPEALGLQWYVNCTHLQGDTNVHMYRNSQTDRALYAYLLVAKVTALEAWLPDTWKVRLRTTACQ